MGDFEYSIKIDDEEEINLWFLKDGTIGLEADDGSNGCAVYMTVEQADQLVEKLTLMIARSGS